MARNSDGSCCRTSRESREMYAGNNTGGRSRKWTKTGGLSRKAWIPITVEGGCWWNIWEKGKQPSPNEIRKPWIYSFDPLVITTRFSLALFFLSVFKEQLRVPGYASIILTPTFSYILPTLSTKEFPKTKLDIRLDNSQGKFEWKSLADFGSLLVTVSIFSVSSFTNLFYSFSSPFPVWLRFFRTLGQSYASKFQEANLIIVFVSC